MNFLNKFIVYLLLSGYLNDVGVEILSCDYSQKLDDTLYLITAHKYSGVSRKHPVNWFVIIKFPPPPDLFIKYY